MKTLLAVSFILLAAASAYAFDFGAIFSGCGRPVPFKDLAAAVPAGPAAGPADSAFPLNIKPEDARRFIESGNPVVIDIRTAEEHAAGYISPTKMLLDYYAPDFKDQLSKLDRNAAYLIYCRSGRRSGAALQVMKDLGFTDIHDIAGGITAWAAAGLPVTK